MIVKRQHVFETNSSSVHSMVIATDEEEKLLNSGELLLYYDSIITKEEAIEKFNKHKEKYPNYNYGDVDYKTYLELETLEEWINNIEERCLNYEYEDYTTKGGEHLNMHICHGEDR